MGRLHPARLYARGTLTAPEVEVIEQLALGRTYAGIAGTLRISSGTVRKHLENIYRKLDCHDRLLVVDLARSSGLVGGLRSTS